MENKIDEIDLIELLQNIVVRTYNFFLRRFKLLVIFGILGGILGVGSYALKRGNYENHIKVVSNSVSPLVLADLFNTLEDIRKSDVNNFSKVLGMDINEAKALIAIEADTLETRAGNKQIVQISTKYGEGLEIKNFTKHLKDYVNRNDFVIKVTKMHRDSSKTIIEKYEKEINKLSKLQEKILSSTSTGNASGKLLLIDDKPISFFHNDILGLEKAIIKEKIRLEFLDEGGFFIVNESEGSKVKRVSLIKTGFKFVAIFVLIGFLISLVLEFGRQARYIENKRKKE